MYVSKINQSVYLVYRGSISLVCRIYISFVDTFAAENAVMCLSMRLW